jgi:hypothetical protein
LAPGLDFSACYSGLDADDLGKFGCDEASPRQNTYFSNLLERSGAIRVNRRQIEVVDERTLLEWAAAPEVY